MKYYRLYIKEPGDKNYSAVDWNNGIKVKNLIFATLFTFEEKERLLSGDLAHPNNAHLTFEFRPAN